MTRSDLKLWLPAVLLVVANLVALAAYRWIYTGRAEAREVRFDRSRTELADLERRRRELARYVESASANRDRLASFFTERLGAEEDRLTQVINEVKTLARTAGLEPSSIAYRREPVRDVPVTKRSLIFSVSGSYLDLRKLINLLELSESFVTLEQVSLSDNDGGGAELRINLQLSVLFAGEGALGAAEDGAAPQAAADAAPAGPEAAG